MANASIHKTHRKRRFPASMNCFYRSWSLFGTIWEAFHTGRQQGMPSRQDTRASMRRPWNAVSAGPAAADIGWKRSPIRS